MSDLAKRLEDLISEGAGGSPQDLALWRERARAVLIDRYGAGDPEVSRFMRSVVPNVIHSAETEASGEFESAQRQAIRDGVAVLRVLAENLDSMTSTAESSSDVKRGRSVFLIHGRDLQAMNAIKALLRSLDVHVVDWEEAVAEVGEPNPYVGEVVETGLRMADGVVILLTPDDLVRLRPDLLPDSDSNDERQLRGQPRPNVLFEAGYAQAIARDRSVIAAVGPIKLHSDIGGRHVVYLDSSPESRSRFKERLRLAQLEIRDSGTDWLTAGEFPDYRQLSPVWDGVDEQSDTDDGDDPEPDDGDPKPDGDDDLPGFLEVLANLEDAGDRMNAAVADIGGVIREMGEVATESSSRLDQSEARGGGARGRLAVAIQYAEALTGPADRLDELVGTYESELTDVLAGLELGMEQVESGAIDDEESVEVFVEALVGLGQSVETSMESLISLIAAIEQTQDMARPVRRQVALIRRSLERFFDASAQILSLSTRAARYSKSS